MSENTELKAALNAAFQRLQDLTSNSTPRDMAYLGHYLKNAGHGSLLNQLMLAGDVQFDAIQAAGDAQVVRLQAAGGAIKEGARPMLFGIMDRGTQTAFPTSDEFGQLHLDNGQKIFQLITGRWGNIEQNKWQMPPSLYYMSGDSWHYADAGMRYIQNSKVDEVRPGADFPAFAISLIFVKNTTDAPISRPLGHIYSAHDNTLHPYGGAMMAVGTPDDTNNNRNEIGNIAWQAVHSKTDQVSAELRTDPVTVPANKTVAVVTFATALPFYETTDQHHQVLHSGFYGLNAFLGGGLEIDGDITQRAQQLNHVADYAIWNQ